MSDSIRIELNCRTPSWCRTFSCSCEGKTSTYLVTRSVRSEVFCVTSKEDSLGRQTRGGRTGFFPTEEGRKLSFPYKRALQENQDTRFQHWLCSSPQK